MRKWGQWSMAVILVILLSGGSAFGQTAPSSPAPPVAFVPPAPLPEDASSDACVSGACWGGQACQGYGRFWVNNEALLWWMKGAQLPALVTASPAGTPQSQAGVLGADNTTVLFGDSRVNTNPQGGWRITAGFWLDQNRRWGIEGSYFLLSTQTTSFSATSNGDTMLARPFFDPVLNQNVSQLVPQGSVAANASTTGLTGAGALFRANLCCGCCYRIDWLGGYRFLRFSDQLGIDETVTSTNVDNFIVPGTTLALSDRFATRNVFNGFDTGLSAQFQFGNWAVEGLAKIAVGNNQRVVDINGSTTVSVPGTPSVTNEGGLLALSSNIGHYSSNHVAVIPEFGARLYYQITPWLRANAGYTFLLWPQVVRPGDAIDTAVNPNLLPPANPLAGGPTHPVFTGSTSTFWAQGVSAGLELRF